MATGKKGAITALAPWAGSKRNMAPAIVGLLGGHELYVEPFAGSMAVLFRKPPSRMEIVNDLHRDLVNVARVLQSETAAEALLRRLLYTLASEETWRAARRAVRRPYRGRLGDVDRAYHALVDWWLGRNGVAGAVNSGSFCARFSASGGSGGVRWRTFVESVPFFCDRLAKVDVLHRDAFALIGALHDKPGLAVFADPPYVEKSVRYEHDFAEADHRRLAAELNRFERAKVVVSYYAHPLLDELYPADRWRRVYPAVAKTMSNTTRKGKTGAVAAPEVLLVNDASPSRPAAGGATLVDSVA